jgi:hypothetical protein
MVTVFFQVEFLSKTFTFTFLQKFAELSNFHEK